MLRRREEAKAVVRDGNVAIAQYQQGRVERMGARTVLIPTWTARGPPRKGRHPSRLSLLCDGVWRGEMHEKVCGLYCNRLNMPRLDASMHSNRLPAYAPLTNSCTHQLHAVYGGIARARNRHRRKRHA